MMKLSKAINYSGLAVGLLLLAGCATTTNNTNQDNVVNTDGNNVNTNAVVNSNTNNSNVVVNANANVNATTNENTNTEVSGEVDTSDWLTYTNEEYGFSFKYPEEWGNISTLVEDGCLQTNITEPCVHVSLEVPSLGANTLLLATSSLEYSKQPVGRGAYWGDEANNIISTEYIVNYCDGRGDACTVYINENGVLVARNIEEVIFSKTPATMYYIKSPNPIYFGIVLSTDRLQDKGISGLNNIMDKVVGTLKFL